MYEKEQPQVEKPRRIPLLLTTKPSREAIKILSALGYEFGPEYAYDTANGISTYYETRVSYKPEGWIFVVGSDYVDKKWNDELSNSSTIDISFFNCKDDELMFLALAAINEDNDLYQIFIRDLVISVPIAGIYIPKGSPFISMTEDMYFGVPEEAIDCPSVCGFHKATKDEILELLKNKDFRQSIHNYFYKEVLERYEADKKANENIQTNIENELSCHCKSNKCDKQCNEKDNNYQCRKETVETLVPKDEEREYALSESEGERIIDVLNQAKDRMTSLKTRNKQLEDIVKLTAKHKLNEKEKEIVSKILENPNQPKVNETFIKKLKDSIYSDRCCSGEMPPQDMSKLKPIRVYISLPITGRENEARVRCKAVKEWLEGHFPTVEFVSPFEISTEVDRPYSYYMGRDIENLLECQGVILLEGWEKSQGCRTEVETAKIYGIKRILFSDLEKAVDEMHDSLCYCTLDGYKMRNYTIKLNSKDEKPMYMERCTSYYPTKNVKGEIIFHTENDNQTAGGESFEREVLENIFSNERYNLSGINTMQLLKERTEALNQKLQHVIENFINRESTSFDFINACFNNAVDVNKPSTLNFDGLILTPKIEIP